MYEALSADQIRTALSFVPNTDRETWYRMAMAVKSELGEDGFEIWDSWSSTDDSYRAKDARQVWTSAKETGGITIASLIHEAKQHGYRHDSSLAISQDEQEARKLKKKEAAETAERAEAEKQRKAAEKSLKIWDSGTPIADTLHPYLSRKKISCLPSVRIGTYPRWHDGTTYNIENCLLIPLRDHNKNLTSLQAIFPETHPALQRDRDYIPGGKKQGSYFTIGKVDSTIVVCEGFATGCSIHDATGMAVAIAFDSSNLIHIAKRMRKAYPDKTIIIAADNDKYGESNPGVRAASAAASACDGKVVVPKFKDESTQPTDFNDLYCLEGAQSVRDAFFPKQSNDETDETDCNNTFFRILGYTHDQFYVYQYEKKQIIALNKSDLSTNGFLELAPEEYWDSRFFGKSSFNKSQAASWFIRSCYAAGVYDPTRTRGRGAWIDNERTVYHFGSHLWVDGVIMDVNQIKSRYVYQLDLSIEYPKVRPLSDAEGQRLLDIAQMFRWNKQASAALLLGWVALAPFSGALRWRPHIWLTGGAGCGKSTILNDYIHPLMAGTSVFAQGNSTEAGLRQTLKTDSLPVLFDETEQNNDREESRVQNVISLIRQSSTESGAITYKGTATGDSMQFIIRSMFCLSSIGVGIKHQADFERLTILSLRPKGDDANAAESWDALKSALASIRADDDLPYRLFTRTILNMPTILQNIKVFVNAASRKFNSVREGDQYGTLMAGCWSVLHTTVATPDQAAALLDSFDWDEYRENTEMDESSRALMCLMESRIRINGGEVSVYEIMRCAATGSAPDGFSQLIKLEAEAILGRHGMRVTDTDLQIANGSKTLIDLFRNTPYHSDWRNHLLRIKGAKRSDNVIRFNGIPCRFVSVPLKIVGLDTSFNPENL